MKKLYYILGVTAAAVIAVAAGCTKNDNLYSDAEYIQFSDTLYMCPVKESADYKYEVVIGSTRKFSYDRTVGVEVVYAKSDAVEGLHYELLEDNVVIKAGELTARVPIKGNFDQFENNDERHVTLRVVTKDNLLSDLYGSEAKVVFKKACEWNIDDLLADGGNFRIFEEISSASTKDRRVKAEKVDDERIIFRNPFGFGRDLRVRFDINGDVFQPELTVLPQLMVNYGEQGYGWTHVRTIKAYPSYLLPCHKVLVLNLEPFVDGMGVYAVSTVLLMWMSQAEADYYYPDYIQEEY